MYFVMMAAIIVVDQLTKVWAQQLGTESVAVLPFLSCTLEYNRGMAFSLGASDSAVIYHVLSACILLLTLGIALYTYRQYKKKRPVWAECALITASLSNMYDRYAVGAVVDFIHVSCGCVDFPIFNIADVVIVLSVAYMIVAEYREGS